MVKPNAKLSAQADDEPQASGKACAISASPLTAEELALLDRLRALKLERRTLAERLRRVEPQASEQDAAEAGDGECVASQARIRDIDREATRLRALAAAARRRRMIALGHAEGVDEPDVSLDELRQGRGSGGRS